MNNLNLKHMNNLTQTTLDQLFGTAPAITSISALGAGISWNTLYVGIAIGLLLAWGINWILSLDWAGAVEYVKNEN